MTGYKVVCGNTQLGGITTDKQEAVKDAEDFNRRARQLTAEDGVRRDTAHVIATPIMELTR